MRDTDDFMTLLLAAEAINRAPVPAEAKLEAVRCVVGEFLTSSRPSALADIAKHLKEAPVASQREDTPCQVAAAPVPAEPAKRRVAPVRGGSRERLSKDPGSLRGPKGNGAKASRKAKG